MAMELHSIYEHTDIPAGMTCAEYRRQRHPANRRRTGLARLRRMLRARA